MRVIVIKTKLISNLQFVPEHSKEAMEVVLKLIYTGTANVDVHILPELFKIGQDLKLKVPFIPELIEVIDITDS